MMLMASLTSRPGSEPRSRMESKLAISNSKDVPTQQLKQELFERPKSSSLHKPLVHSCSDSCPLHSSRGHHCWGTDDLNSFSCLPHTSSHAKMRNAHSRLPLLHNTHHWLSHVANGPSWSEACCVTQGLVNFEGYYLDGEGAYAPKDPVYQAYKVEDLEAEAKHTENRTMIRLTSRYRIK